MIIKCKVLMNSSDEVAELTGKTESSWEDCVVDSSVIVAVRRSIADRDGEHGDLAVIHFDADYWIINIQYDEFVKKYFPL